MGTARKIVVVGSGIAGLAAAYDLRKAGCTVTVLESGDQPGGRMANVRSGHMLLETGATEIFSFYTDLLDLTREIGLADELVEANFYRRFRIMDNGHEHDFDYGAGPLSLLTSKRLSARTKLRLPLLMPDLLHFKNHVDPCFIESAADYDDEDLDSYLSRKVGRDFVDGFIAPLFRLFWRWQPQDFSRAYFLAFVAHTIGSRIYTFRNGVGSLTRALADRLDVRYRAAVTAVERIGDGRCRVVYHTAEGEQALEADGVVMATPSPAVQAIVRDLSSDDRAFLSAVRYSQGMAVHYLLKRPVEPKSMIYSARDPSKLLSYAQVPAGFPGFPDVPDRLWVSLTPEYLAANVAPHGANLDAITRPHVTKLYPSLEEDLLEVHTQYDGLFLAQVYPGYIRKLRSFLVGQDASRSPIVLCGDYLAHPHTGGACASGRRAARQLLRRLDDAAEPQMSDASCADATSLG